MKNNKTQSSFEIILDHHIKSNDNDIIIEIEDNQISQRPKYFNLNTLKESILPFNKYTNFITTPIQNILHKLIFQNQLIQHVSTNSLLRLYQHQCLNDEVVNSYIKLLANLAENQNQSLFIFNSYFFTNVISKSPDSIRKYLENKNNINIHSKLIIPLFVDDIHWCFAVIEPQRQKIQYYDSQGLIYSHLQSIHRGLNQIVKLLKGEYYEKEIMIFPKQENEKDCGVFMLQGISDFIINRPMKWNQKDIKQIREQMTYELINNQLFIR